MQWFKLGKSDSQWLGIPPHKRTKLLGMALVVILVFTAIYILQFYF
ncbi:MAG: hypothetical protein ACE5DN_02610 [Flavobacteriales bacterium]